MPVSSINNTLQPAIFAVALGLIGAAAPGSSQAEEATLDYRSFDCAGFLRRQGTLLELGERVSGEWVFREFTCFGRSCVLHRQDETASDEIMKIFHHIYFVGDGLRYVSTKANWGPGSALPLSHKSITINPSSCFTMMPDEENWTLDMGELSVENGELHAVPKSGDYRVDYYYAPARLLGDWSYAEVIKFEKKSSGGLRYLPAYLEDIYGDVVLRSGSMRASYEIPQHHTGEWRAFEVPLDGPGWKFKGGATSLSDILGDVTGFQIRAQYGPGKNSSALRNVVVE